MRNAEFIGPNGNCEINLRNGILRQKLLIWRL